MKDFNLRISKKDGIITIETRDTVWCNNNKIMFITEGK